MPISVGPLSGETQPRPAAASKLFRGDKNRSRLPYFLHARENDVVLFLS